MRGNCGNCRGKLSIVGIGPGDLEHLSKKAREAIIESEVIIGYASYIKLLASLRRGKEVIASGMRQELSRAGQAMELACKGKKVCLISSGDPGIYGMASVVLELFKKADGKNFTIEIIPGITAACAAASLLGAPLAQDFAVISLSDLLVSSLEIEKKLEYSIKADFVVVLYNPKSRTREKPLQTAWDIMLRHRPSNTPVGIVKNAYRLGQEIKIMPLKEAVLLKGIDMATTIIVGNSRTFIKDGYLITKRGYDINNGTR